MITPEILNDMFRYSAGCLYKKNKGGRLKVGQRVGSYDKRYRKVQIDGRKYLEHRLIFLMHHWYLPKVVDHINGDSFDNRVENLRESTTSLNCANRKGWSKSKFKGVYRRKNRYESGIRNGKLLFLGSFGTPEEAAEAYDKKAIEIYGASALTNFPKENYESV